MKVRYETGVATLVQFVVTLLLTLVSSVASVVSGCINQSGANCAGNTFVSLLLIILTIGALGCLVAIGYVAQERRSRRLALLLMGAEGLGALIYLFDTKQSPGILDRITNFLSFVIAVWVIVIAWKLAQARGGRIVRQHVRKQHAKR